MVERLLFLICSDFLLSPTGSFRTIISSVRSASGKRLSTGPKCLLCLPCFGPGPLFPTSVPCLAYFPYFEKIKAGLLSVSVARQRLSKHFSAAKNTEATTEELLDAVFYMQSVLYGILNI
jgi:hypothetical protein